MTYIYMYINLTEGLGIEKNKCINMCFYMDNLCYIFVIVISGYFLQFCSKKLYYFLNTLTPIKKVQVFFNDVSPLFY